MESYYERNKEAILAKRKEQYIRNKEVRQQANKEWREQNPEKFREYRNKWISDHPSWNMYKNAKRRAVDYNLPFDITMDDIEIPTHCPILGIPLIPGTGSSTENSPSLDRILPEWGYIKGNIHVISSKANRLKNNATVEELEKLYLYFRDLI